MDYGDIDSSITFRIFLEPVSRNTCPAIGYALCYYYEIDRYDGQLLFLPADHIYDNDEFLHSMKTFNIDGKDKKCTIFGIKPTCPETGYGYIQHEAGNVISFKEKPSLTLATEYLEKGNYCWNSGMFMLSKEILPLFMKNNEETYDILIKLLSFDDLSSNVIIIGKEYEMCEDISIDYGLIEKMPVEEMSFFYYQGMWSDIGSYNSLVSFSDDYDSYNSNGTKDDNKKNYVKSSKKVITNGVNNVAIIETDDILLIFDLDQSQNIKTIFKNVSNVYKRNTHISYEDCGFSKKIYEDKEYDISKVTIYPNKTVNFDEFSHFIDERDQSHIYTNFLVNVTENNQTFIRLSKSDSLL